MGFEHVFTVASVTRLSPGQTTVKSQSELFLTHKIMINVTLISSGANGQPRHSKSLFGSVDFTMIWPVYFYLTHW